MARFTSYPNKAKPTDSDTLLINDSGSSSNKQVLFSAVLSWFKDKLGTSTIDGLDTTDKTVVGSINEINTTVGNKADSSSVYTKTQVDALIESVGVETDTTLSVSGKPADAKTVGDELSQLQAELDSLEDRVEALEEGGSGGSGLSNTAKTALLALLSKVAYTDDDGQTYYDDLYDALYPTTPPTPATLTSITCVYTQSGTVESTDTLDSLKPDLVVTSHYSDNTTQTVTAYTLSGTLVAGSTSTITVTYSGKTATFTVNVASDAVELSSITAVYSGGSVESSTSLDSLKSDLVVTAHYSDQTTSVIGDSAYTLSGTLVADTTSTITVSYSGKTTTFTVSVNSDTPTHLYVIDDETLFTRGKGCGNTAPNYISNGARISYNHFDILVEAGKTYRATAQSTYDTAYMAVRLTSEGGRTNVANEVNITGTQDNDSGWQGLAYNFTVPSNFGTSAARFVFKQDSAGSTVSDDWSITEIVIDEVTT